MLKLNFYSASGEMEKLWNTQNFKNYMLNSNLAKKLELSAEQQYEEFCEGLCENSVSWMIYQLLLNDYSIENVYVNEGCFDNQHHFWVRMDDYYIDLTLCQFLTNCPDLAITKVSEVVEKEENLYYPVQEYLAKDWIQKIILFQN